MPFEQIAEKRLMPEYNTENMAIRMMPSRILEAIENDDGTSTPMARLFGPEAVKSEGLGYLTRPCRAQRLQERRRSQRDGRHA